MTCQVYDPLCLFFRTFSLPHGSDGRIDGLSTGSATVDQPLSRALFCVGDT